MTKTPPSAVSGQMATRRFRWTVWRVVLLAIVVLAVVTVVVLLLTAATRGEGRLVRQTPAASLRSMMVQ